MGVLLYADAYRKALCSLESISVHHAQRSSRRCLIRLHRHSVALSGVSARARKEEAMRFWSGKEGMKYCSPGVWPNVLMVVVLAVGWLVAGCGGGPPQPAERCGSIQFVNGQSREPKVVVVLLDGATSQVK